MTIKCPRCNEVFDFQCRLDRHLSRKKLCKKIAEDNQCKYCNKTFTTFSYLKTHIETCKLREDPIRKMEIQLNINENIDPTTCRYCKKTYTRVNNANAHMKTCKEKDAYIASLEEQLKEMKGKQPETGEKVVNNAQNAGRDITNNNAGRDIINNNIMINLVPFGQENFDYIDTKVVMRLADKYLKMKQDMTGFIRAVTRLMHGHPNHPENHNVLMHGVNKPQATVYTERGFELRNAVEMTGKIVMNGGEAVLTTYEEAEKEDQRKIGERQYLKVEDIVSEGEHTRKFGSFRNAVKVALSDPKVRTNVKNTQKQKAKEEEEYKEKKKSLDIT